MVDLVIISYMATGQTFEEFFKANFSIDFILLDEQEFMKKIKGLPKLLLVQTIEGNLKWKKAGVHMATEPSKL